MEWLFTRPMESAGGTKDRKPREPKMDKVTILQKFFIQRSDVYGRQFPDGHYEPVKKELSTSVLQAHIAGKETNGTYLLDTTNTCRLGVFDVDRTDDPAKEFILALKRVGEHYGLKNLIEFSGRRGYHDIHFFEPMPATKVRRLLTALKKEAEEACCFTVKPEVFPKQDSIQSDGVGNLIKLPWAKHKVSGQWSHFVDDNFQPIADQEALFDNLQLTSETTIDEILSEFGLVEEPPKSTVEDYDYPKLTPKEEEAGVTKLLESCAFIRHCRDDATALPEPDWWALCNTLHHFGEVGEETIYKLSSPYPSYSERETRYKIKKASGKPHTCKYIQESLGFQCPSDCTSKKLGTHSPVTMALKAIHPERVTKFRLTDMGNGERLTSQFGDIIRYCPERKMWAVYSGKVWEWDIGATKVRALAKQIIRGMYQEANGEADEDKRKAIAKHAIQSETDYRITSMLNLAQIEPGITIGIGKFDNEPWLFNCRNRTLDLRTGILRPHSKDDLLTVIVPIDYLPGALCPHFSKFINRIMKADFQLIEYVQRCIGYSLTGSVREQVFFFLWGRGNNGKTTLINIVRKMCGDYADRIPIEALLFRDKNTGGPKEGLANLKGKRLAVTSEMPGGRRLQESIIKDVAGNDSIKADRKFEHEIEFMPMFKLWMFGNHKPNIRDTTKGFWRKFRLIPFDVEITEAERDKTLPEKLETELPGILAWAVQGCLKWQAGGLGESTSVTTATQEYQEDQDILAPFIEGCCTIGKNEDCTKDELYTAYLAWCSKAGEHELTKRMFGERLIEKGFDSTRTSGTRLWLGMSLK